MHGQQKLAEDFVCVMATTSYRDCSLLSCVANMCLRLQAMDDAPCEGTHVSEGIVGDLICTLGF